MLQHYQAYNETLMFLDFGLTRFVGKMMCLRHTAHAMSVPYVVNLKEISLTAQLTTTQSTNSTTNCPHAYAHLVQTSGTL